MQSDRDSSHLYQPFRTAYAKVLADMQDWLNVHRPGQTCKMIEGLRSSAYQHQLWLKGRNGNPGPIVTYKDGFDHKSNHQSGLAADIGIFNDGAYIEEPDAETMAYYGHLVRLHGLQWGGNWTSFIDQPHAEWPTTDQTTYQHANQWLREEGLQ